MACVNSADNLISVKWFQITPLLDNADSVVVRKYSVNDSDTTLLNTFYLVSINWTLSSTNNQTLATLKSVAKNEEQNYDTEVFDFTSPMLDFTFDAEKSLLNCNVGVGATSLKYVFEFKGTQKISYKDFLKTSTSCNSGTSAANVKVIAL